MGRIFLRLAKQIRKDSDRPFLRRNIATPDVRRELINRVLKAEKLAASMATYLK